ncbi:neuropeptide FF receptor 2 [Exaiptasia diaphana]|uniref:G-protein coupled receptors family 1 profile domain-containing protein n=1 Tax=Exaiptasia diaphana TaxID=2652724 RepID=A0A913XM67_EXADI|nr:neuropeptide FF receptor 2 [Exaiptasia diaphana]XP_020906546.1 neuropeptide FF receptor 2 [Exaiptasia diaphana]XP_020906547.1 neuropeptide FF receptor 2 [Exaiptasia diaphana]XP_028516522.1 neuropeptide FF receptor 2 [Exaiptasia diaphana]
MHNISTTLTPTPLTDFNITNPSSTCHLHKDSRLENVIKIVLYIVAMVVSLGGNTLLIYAVKQRKRMHTVTNFLIINMAAADLFITVFNMPTYLEILITQKYDWMGGPLGVLLCKLVLFIQGVSVTCSVLTLTVLSVHRFVSVFFPWKKLMNTKNVKFAIAGIWIASFLFISPLLYALNVMEHNRMLVCDERWSPLFDEKQAPKNYTIVLFVLLYMAPLLIMAVLYSCLIYKLWFRCPSELPASSYRRQSEEALSVSRVSSDDKSKHAKSKKLVLKMLVTVVVVFALCWLPMHVRSFFVFFSKDGLPCLPSFLEFIGYFLGHANSALNPCIYVSFSESYRHTFKTVLFKLCGKKKVKTPVKRPKRDVEVELQKKRLNYKYHL